MFPHAVFSKCTNHYFISGVRLLEPVLVIDALFHQLVRVLVLRVFGKGLAGKGLGDIRVRGVRVSGFKGLGGKGRPQV